MALKELHGNFSYSYSRQGMVGHREFECAWAERDTVGPRYGDAFPGKPALKVANVEVQPLGAPTGKSAPDAIYTYAKLVVDYSTYQRIEDAPEFSHEFGGEVLEVGIGRQWLNAGTPIEQALGVFYPQDILTITLTERSVPTFAIWNALGKVNFWPFLGAPPEQLLFEGASLQSQYDYERNIYIFKVTYRFIYRAIPHNIVWRSPRQRRFGDGILMYTGSDSPQGPGWPIYDSSRAGKAGWDRPYPALYAGGDFGPLMGEPARPIPRFQPLKTALGAQPKITDSATAVMPCVEDGIGGSLRQ